MALPVGKSSVMSGRRLLLLLQQRLKRAHSWKCGSIFRSNCQCSNVPARLGGNGRRSGAKVMFPIVALQAFGLPGVFQWGSKEDKKEPEQKDVHRYTCPAEDDCNRVGPASWEKRLSDIANRVDPDPDATYVIVYNADPDEKRQGDLWPNRSYRQTVQTLIRQLLQKILSECQTDWILMRRRVTRRLIWIQTVCKEPEAPEDPDKATISEADRLYAANDVKPLYEFLVKHKDSENPEILWRLARATTDLGKHAILEDIKQDCYMEAFRYIERALQFSDNNFAVHKWYAILLDYTGEIEGTKKRISNAFKVKDHFQKALELNPNDPTTIHSLGYWCYVFADLKWYERKIASAFYATPPTSTFQEALDYFQKAEQMEPNFYSANLLMLGKTYMKLRDPVLAYTYLKKCAEYPVKTPDDKQSHVEAVKLLKSMGIKDDNKP